MDSPGLREMLHRNGSELDLDKKTGKSQVATQLKAQTYKDEDDIKKSADKIEIFASLSKRKLSHLIGPLTTKCSRSSFMSLSTLKQTISFLPSAASQSSGLNYNCDGVFWNQ